MDSDEKALWADIENYEFYSKNGWFDLEKFVSLLFWCFYFDFNKDRSKYPDRQHIRDLLVQIMQREMTAKEFNEALTFNDVPGWTPQHPYYCSPKRPLFHMKTMIKYQAEWVAEIGAMVGFPPQDDSPYLSWVNPDWVFVHKFIHGYHDAHWQFHKEWSAENKDRLGYSLTEALALSKRSEVPFEDAIAELKTVEIAKSDALLRIGVAIEQKFYLEAIVLQECLFTNLFLSYLDAKKVKPKSDSLYDVLQEFQKKQIHLKNDDLALVKSVDEWRKQRNLAVHGYVSVRKQDRNKNHSHFMQSSKDAALKGHSLLKEVIAWYENEAKGFLVTSWPATSNTRVMH
ncbi:hypothetical protein [Iodobacter fluviatilis]|uniref:Uncharacterized protein n=1 Tax=Iodobacter fluviatilis TaxID=537 RepID=A0A377SW22_9NEIS|nr:hypothetical protein [Iodobacter fluviatilis]TCU81331.1 hypothetical protein EV682_12344 [Iodobacter fluviatilis]STR45187.1 Uncharacterised protein [Iodobacter fluviatilis]